MEVSRFCRSAISEPKNSRVSLEGSEVSVKVTWSLGVESLLLFTWGCKTKHAHANINMHKHTDMVMIKYICKICIISQKIKIKEMDLINRCTWKTISKSSTWLSKTWCTIRKSDIIMLEYRYKLHTNVISKHWTETCSRNDRGKRMRSEKFIQNKM